jgi:hypothetical protein
VRSGHGGATEDWLREANERDLAIETNATPGAQISTDLPVLSLALPGSRPASGVAHD